MANKPKPWQRGYIPTVGKREDAGWTAPDAPPGWYRTDRRDLVEYQYGDPVTSEFYTPNFARVCIIGGIGLPWRLYRRFDPLRGVFTSPVFESHSLDTVAMWWSIEQSNQPEPSGFDDYEEGYTSTGRYTRIGKTVSFGMAYGAGANQLAKITGLPVADFSAAEQRVAAMYHDELAVYCQADVKTAADLYADFAKNFKGSKP